MKKRRKYVVMLALLGAAGILFWWLWRRAPPVQTVERSSVVAQPVHLTVAPMRQVAPPRLAPVAASDQAASSPSADVPADLNNTIAQAITLLQNKDIPGLMHELVPPAEWDEWQAEMLHHGVIQSSQYMMSVVRLRAMLTTDQMRQLMQQLGIPVDEHLAESYTRSPQQDLQQARFLRELQGILNQSPEVFPDGMHVRYLLNLPDDPTADGVNFEEINGQWYLQN